MARKAKRASKELKEFVAIFRERPDKTGGLTPREKDALVAARKKHTSTEMSDSIGIHVTSLNRYIRNEKLQKRIEVSNKTKTDKEAWKMSVNSAKQIFINGKRVSRELALKSAINTIL